MRLCNIFIIHMYYRYLFIVQWHVCFYWRRLDKGKFCFCQQVQGEGQICPIITWKHSYKDFANWCCNHGLVWMYKEMYVNSYLWTIALLPCCRENQLRLKWDRINTFLLIMKIERIIWCESTHTHLLLPYETDCLSSEVIVSTVAFN